MTDTRKQIADEEASRQLVEYLQTCLEIRRPATPEDLLVEAAYVFLSHGSRRDRRRAVRRFRRALAKWEAA